MAQRHRMSKREISELQQYILSNKGKWRRGDDRKVAQMYGTTPQVVARYRYLLGVYFITPDEIVEFVEKHPNMPPEEIATSCGVCVGTLRRIDKMQKMGLFKGYKAVGVTQQDVEGKTFQEVKEMLGVSDSYLCHIKKRYNLQFYKPMKDGKVKRKEYGHRKNLYKIRHSSIKDIATLLTEKPWCTQKRCNKECYLCCVEWLKQRES